MKRLLIGLLLVTLLVSGCRQAVVTIPPLSTTTPTTTALTWDSVASLPVGTVVELTGYCVGEVTIKGIAPSYTLAEVSNYYASRSGIILTVLSSNPPVTGVHLKISAKIISSDGGSIQLSELKRTIIN